MVHVCVAAGRQVGVQERVTPVAPSEEREELPANPRLTRLPGQLYASSAAAWLHTSPHVKQTLKVTYTFISTHLWFRTVCMRGMECFVYAVL